MVKPNEPPEKVKQAQAKATNPAHSVWVSANAGSGKTYVLARRVIRLMLQNTKPSQILCLTFTKAAAAEMSNRVFELLGAWTVMDEADLKEEISSVTGQTPTPLELVRARQLFALALDTPGGLKIQTIHAFCDALLHQFPLEANVPAHFDQIDESEQLALLEESQRQVILQSLGRGFTEPDQVSLLANAFTQVRSYASDDAIDKALSYLISQRDAFLNWTDGDLLGRMDHIWQNFDLSREQSEQEIAKQLNSDSYFSDALLNEYKIQAEIDGGTTLIKLAGNIDFYFRQDTQLEKFHARMKIFFTKAGKGTPRKQFGTKTFTDSMPDLRDRFEQETELLTKQTERIKLVQNLQASEALFIISQAIFTEYENIKQRRGKLDFSDLIQKAANLLTRNNISAWVQYKLDRGIDHVLIDEAQDTSPLQWQVINAITTEFFTGDGARELNRTLFVVGDEKQSIYSFQGADPIEFGEQYKRLEKNADKSFESISLGLSFRSTQEVLSAVDQVFSLPENRRGLSILDDLSPHTAHRASDKGEVILWPIVPKPEKPSNEDWRTPPDKLGDDAEVTLANRIATEIKGWIDTKQRLPGRGELIKEGDILILLRKRDKFASAITKALKAKGLATAGADRLKLTEHIFVEDMMALGKFVTMQSDDLALASILKSPLFGFSEEELFTVCQRKKNVQLSTHLASFESENGPINQRVERALKILFQLIKLAQQVPVFEFYSGLFARFDLRKSYLARLGKEVEEVIDGFLQTAIKHDSKSATGLISFIEWLENTAPQIKREIDLKTNEIRVITVHSSKGLEAPIVFLVDPCTKAFNTRHTPPIASINVSTESEGFIWQPKIENRIEASGSYYAEFEEAAEKEYRRLLYVGMTRAADRLIVCGYGDENCKHDHWHSMIENGLDATPHSTRHIGKLVENNEGDFPTKNWEIENPAHRPVELEGESVAFVCNASIPEWATRPAPHEAAPPRPLTPSGAMDMLDIAPQDFTDNHTYTEDGKSARLIGNATHALLQVLPDAEPNNFEEIINKYFASFGEPLNAGQQGRIKENILALLQSAEMQQLLGTNSRAEISLSGSIQLGKGQYNIHGQIDRLVINEDEVIFADYKTNRFPPDQPDKVPGEYLAQLALYRHLLREIYPKHRISAKLIWVQTSSIMAIPEAILDTQMKIIEKQPA